MSLANPDFELRSPIISKPNSDWIRVAIPLSSDILRSSFTNITPEQVKNTVLDFSIDNTPAVVKLVPNFQFYISDLVFSHLRFRPGRNMQAESVRSLMLRRDVTPADVDKCFITTTSDSWFYVPSGSNRVYELDTGRAVVDHFQRAVNGLIVCGNSLVAARDVTSASTSFQLQRAEVAYQAAITEYFNAVKKILFFKGGYLDSKIASVMPFSGRAVIVCDPRINLEEAGIPKHIIAKWFRSRLFRESYDLEDLSFDEACSVLRGTYILFGRQPSHDCSNFISVKMIPVAGTAIHVNPFVVNLYDGDFDGDTCHIYALQSRKARQALPRMSIERIISECRAKKELSGIKLSAEINAANHIARRELKRFIQGDLLGYSLDVHDLLADCDGTGYFDDKKVHRADLRKATIGFSIDEAWDESISAMMDFRMIKQGVAQAGGISNCLMQLAILRGFELDKRGRHEEAREIVKSIQQVKHMLCQGMLNRKHGNRQESGNKSVLEMLSSMIYRFEDCPFNTRDEYLTYLTDEAALPEAGARYIVDLLFSYGGDPPDGIYKILMEKSPAYVMTRNPAGMHILPSFVNSRSDASLHDVFLRARLIEDEEKNG